MKKEGRNESWKESEEFRNKLKVSKKEYLF